LFRIDRRLVKISDTKINKLDNLDKFDEEENIEVDAEGETPDAATSATTMSSPEDIVNEYLNAAKSETETKMEAILENARKQAAKIISDAENEAEEERERGRQEGYDEGKAEGIEEGKRSFDQQLAEKMKEDDEALKRVLDEIYEERERINNELEEGTTNLAVEIVRKIFNPPDEILADVFILQIKNALRQMSTDGKIVIRVGPAEYERFFSSGAATIELDSGIKVNAEVIRDVSLNEGDLIIDTDNVTVNAGLDSQLQYVQIAFERANQYEPD